MKNNFPWRTFSFFRREAKIHLGGLIRRCRTKSYRTLGEADVEKLKKVNSSLGII